MDEIGPFFKWGLQPLRYSNCVFPQPPSLDPPQPAEFFRILLESLRAGFGCADDWFRMQAEKRLVGHTGRSARLHLRHALGRLGLHLVARPLWGILRFALCLQTLSVEYAIATKAAAAGRLRVVLKTIRKR